MDIPEAAVLWTVVGVGLAVLLLALAALTVPAVRRRGRGPGRVPVPPPSAGGFPEDDLPGFLEHPPGSGREPSAAASGWAALSGAARPAAPAPHPTRRSTDRWTRIVLGSAAAAALLLVAAGLAGLTAGRPAGDREARAGGPPAGRHDDRPSGDGDAERALPAVPSAPAPGQPGAGALADTSVPLGRDGVAADLTFGGVVLEQRAVGVTATYPRLTLTGNGSRWVAHVQLPTYNCLAATAPADPVAAGCSPALPEYADLPSPALRVTREHDGRLQVTGRFPTYLRSNGAPPDWTGRSYELTVTAAPAGHPPARGRVDAVGELRLGTGRAATAGVSVLRFAG